MRKLILLRHGEAERRADSGRDVDRALTEAGRLAAARAGADLAQAGLRPDLALVSVARRAQATWAQACGAWPASVPPADVRPDLYEADADEVLAAAGAQAAAVVLVVAHNPGLQVLAARLAQDDPHAASPAAQGFPPAAFAAFEREPAGWRLLAWRVPETQGAA